MRISNGAIDAFPTRQAIEAFRYGVDNSGLVAFRQLAEVVLRLSTEPMLPETKCLVLETLLDSFPTDSATKAALGSLRDQCERLMILNPLELQRFLTCFNRWIQKHTFINPFVIS